MNERFDKSMGSRETRLSAFLAQELLLDFLDGEVDQSRRRILEDRFANLKELKKSKLHIETARAYALQLREVEPSRAMIEKMQRHASGWSFWTERIAIRKWPNVARWSAEAFLISSIFVGLVLLLPAQKLRSWIPLPSRGVVLKEVDTTYPGQTQKASRSQDLVAKAETNPKSISQPTVSTSKMVATDQSAPTKGTATDQPKSSETARTSAPVEAGSKLAGSKLERSAKDTKSRSFVFRASLEVKDIKGSTEGLKALIESLQGKKAGQVDLGWQQDRFHSYFHFALPEQNFETLMSGVRSFGRVRIFRDAHWRVMPPGQVRIILEVRGRELAPVEGGSSGPSVEAGSSSSAGTEREPTPESMVNPSPANETAD